ncbi:MAG: beta-propeller domain-containing protein, partial [Ruminococcus sp.]|nr:beta-propeller domain-containing protein [Ruminococcus sp.]
FTVISKMDTSIVENSLSSKAVFGTSGGAYFGSKSLYLTAYKYDENLFNKQNSDDASYIHLPVSETKVVKVNLSDELSFADTAKISGYIDSSYSFDEKDSVLRVVSVKTLDNDKFTESANIFVLDKDMKCIGKVTDFSNNESIRTVRYIDDTAYVIAYKTPSPLFIIDLKNNNEPKILGETKINGFSPTLVPIDDKTLLSVGFYTAKENDKDSDGIKLVTFDISNKANPKKIDEKILKNYESPVQYNQNALLIDSVKNDYIMPMLYENYNSADESYETKCGILNFKVENGKINIVNDYTSTIFQSSDENSVSVDRCVTTGDWVYLLGSDVSYYNADGNALIEAVKK